MVSFESGQVCVNLKLEYLEKNELVIYLNYLQYL